MHEPLLPPSNSAATQVSHRRNPNTKMTPKKMEFSKQLTIIDICCWTIVTLVLLIVMLVMPTLAEYCVSIFGGATAAYVSLRLGYTAKAGVENYQKINSTVRYTMYDDQSNG